MTADRTEWRKLYGADFLERLSSIKDWRAVEALWRWGSTTDLPALATRMAQSGDPTLAMLLGVELTMGRFADQLGNLPDLLHEHAPIVSEKIAAQVLSRMVDDNEPLPAPYCDKGHLLISWLMHQPGADLDHLAVEIALGGHECSETLEPTESAIRRIALAPELGARLIAEFAVTPERWATGPGWTRTATVVARLGTNPKGRAELVRTLTVALLQLPAGDAVQPTPEFVKLMERHAAKDLAAAFSGEELPDRTGTMRAVYAVASFEKTSVRDDLVIALAGHQPTLWSAYRAETYARWSVDDWRRALGRWAAPGSALVDASAVVADAPVEVDELVVRLALVHGTGPGDPLARVASDALKRLVTTQEGDDEVVDVERVVESVPWDLLSTESNADYLIWMLDSALGVDAHGGAVIRAFDHDIVAPALAATLIPDAKCLSSLEYLKPGSKRAAFAAALVDDREADFIYPILTDLVASSGETFDVIEVMAAYDTEIAFGSFDEERWHSLNVDSRDQLIDLLERHATLRQAPLLDLIAGDSEGSNAGRRARAARRWAQLAPLHGDIPSGVFSLLNSARPDLNQTFAHVAVTVQPRDEQTLLRLREKWVQGGKIGEDARTALDAIATGAVATLASLTGPARRSEGPSLLRILGVTAARSAFESLINHVGADAIDDDLGLRRAAAAATRTFVDATGLDSKELAALGTGAATEPDAEAGDHLREALAAARMGEDAAILLLYDIAGLASSEVSGTPDELFGEQKPRLLTALKRLVVQRELGPPGWEGYVEQMDLVAEALVRAAYLRFGDSESLKTEIKKNTSTPDYGVLVKALGKAKGFDGPSVHLQSLHDMRSNRTAAHHPKGGPLDEDAIGGAVNALETASREIIVRLQNNGPLLRAVDRATGETAS